jgi:outer membrane protein, adhesin transport system
MKPVMHKFVMRSLPCGVKAFLLASFFGLFTQSSFAQTVFFDGAELQEKKAITLSHAMQLALHNHPNMRSRRAAVEAAASELDAAQLARLPSLSWGYSKEYERGAAPGRTTSLTQPLWTGGRLSADIAGRKAQLHWSQQIQVESERELLERVASSYSEALRLLKRIAVAEQNVQEHQRLSDIIEQRVRRDVGAAVDVSLAQARLQQATLDLFELHSQLKSQRFVLGQLVGAAVLESELKDIVITDIGSHEHILQQVLEQSPTLKRLQAEYESVESDLKSRSSVLWPQVSLRIQHNNRVDNVDRSKISKQLLMEFQLGAGLSAPSLIQAAAKRLDVAKSGLDIGLLQINEQVSLRLNELTSAQESLPRAQIYEKANGEVIESYMRQFIAGRKSWQEVLNAQREWTQSRQVVIDLQASLALTTTRLQIMKGHITEEALASSLGH